MLDVGLAEGNGPFGGVGCVRFGRGCAYRTGTADGLGKCDFSVRTVIRSVVPTKKRAVRLDVQSAGLSS